MRRLLRRLREARGQTLVFFVVLMGGLVLLLAFVLNVGAVASTQRQVQSLADGAALTGVQQLPFDSFQAQTDAKRYESCPSDCQISVESSGLSGGPVDTVSVQASRSVSGLLLPLVTTPTAKATASARIEPAQALDNGKLLAVSTPDPAPFLVPLVINASEQDCRDFSCFGPSGRSVTLSLARGEFGFICPESSRCQRRRFGGGGGSGASTLASWFDRGSALQRTYGPSAGSGGADVPVASPRAVNSPAVRGALLADEGEKLIVPLFSSPSDSSYSLVGFAAFVITDVSPGWGGPGDKEISGYFDTYTTPDSPPGNLASVPPDTPPTPYGVSVIGLTQ